MSEKHVNHSRKIGNNLFCVQYTSKIKISQVAKFLPEGHTNHTNLTFTDRLHGLFAVVELLVLQNLFPQVRLKNFSREI